LIDANGKCPVLAIRQNAIGSVVNPKIFMGIAVFLCKAAIFPSLCFNSYKEALGSSQLSNESSLPSLRLDFTL